MRTVKDIIIVKDMGHLIAINQITKVSILTRDTTTSAMHFIKSASLSLAFFCYEYEKRSNTPERGHKPYTKRSNYKYDKYYNSKSNKRSYTSYDRGNTPPPKQEFNRSQNNSYDKQPAKKKVDFKENSEKDMYCIEILDGPDDDNDNEIDDEEHMYMSQKVHKKLASSEDMSSSESSDSEFINSSIESSTLSEDEKEQEEEKVEFNMLEIVPFTPTPLEDQMNKMLRALEKDLDIPIHTESYYRTTLKRMLFGFIENQEYLQEDSEFNHTKVLDNLIMLYGVLVILNTMLSYPS
jgi:hypothetical protein